MVETSDGWSIYDIPIVSQRGNRVNRGKSSRCGNLYEVQTF